MCVTLKEICNGYNNKIAPALTTFVYISMTASVNYYVVRSSMYMMALNLF